MYKGVSTNGKKFYDLLWESDEFTSELGKVILASGRLETELIKYLENNKIEGKDKKLTLGALVNLAKKNNLLDKNMLIILKLIIDQRNYLSHNIYALLMNLIPETILEKNNLLDSDVALYIERARSLKEDLILLSEIIEKEKLHVK